MKNKCLVIADTGVILSLIVVDKLNLLETLFSDVFIPQAVLDELKAIGNPVIKEKAIAFFSSRVKSIKQINNLSLLMDNLWHD